MNRVISEHRFPKGQIFRLVQGDLLQENVEAIVNAANSQLQHGGGVAGAISRRGGPQIQAESNAWVRQHGPAAPERPAHTRAGSLPFRYIIHAVGPVWGEGDEDAKLSTAVRSSLGLANELELASVAFPAISTGIFGFPLERAAKVILGAVQDFFTKDRPTALQQAHLVLFDQKILDVFLREWESSGLGEKGH